MPSKRQLPQRARSLKLLKGAHIKIGWVSCRVRRKKEVRRCFRCLDFGHIAADCRGSDRSRCCWRCGEEGHLAGSCNGKLRCFLCAAKEEKPRNDHIPGTMRCAAFLEAAPNRKPQKGRYGREPGPVTLGNRRRSKKERLTSPAGGPHPEVMPNGGSGVGFHGLETGREFQ